MIYNYRINYAFEKYTNLVAGNIAIRAPIDSAMIKLLQNLPFSETYKVCFYSFIKVMEDLIELHGNGNFNLGSLRIGEGKEFVVSKPMLIFPILGINVIVNGKILKQNQFVRVFPDKDLVKVSAHRANNLVLVLQ